MSTATGAALSNAGLTVLSEDEEMFRASVREFAEGEVRPRVEQMEHASKLDSDLIKQCFELGLMAIESPEEYGGAGSTIFNAIIAIEEIARVDASLSVFVDVHNTLVTNAFMRWGNDDLKKKYLSQMAESKVGAFALSEASSGSDAFALKTRALDKGDHYELNGQTLWITNGNEAEIFIVFATIDPEAGYKGITAFIVEKGFEGFSVGKKEDKLGIRASSTTELILDNCKVPKENVLGEVGKGYKISIETLNEGRVGIGAQMLGIAQGAYEAALKYTAEREQFGQTIGSFQAVQFQLAEMALEIEATRLLVYNAARLKDPGKPYLKQAAKANLFSSRSSESDSSKAIHLKDSLGIESLWERFSWDLYPTDFSNEADSSSTDTE